MLTTTAVTSLATAGVDIVEVLRGSTAGPLLVAAGAAGGAAAGAALVTVASWLVLGRDRDRAHARDPQYAGDHARVRDPAHARDHARVRVVQVAGVVALLLTSAEVVLLLADGAGIGDRWLTVVLARLLLLLAFLERDGHRRARDLLSVPVLASSLLGAPLAAGASPTPVVLSAAVAGLAGSALVLRFATRVPLPRRSAASRPAPVPATTAILLLLIAFGVGLATLSTPEAVPPHHQERVVVDGLTFDLTIAPARPGPNEAHLYAFDAAGQPTPVREVSIEVEGAPGTAHELFEVSPDHHLTYALELPPDSGWRVVFQLTGTDGRARTLELPVPGEGG